MSRFGKKIRVIPETAWGVAIVLSAAMFCGLFLFALPHDKNFRLWPVIGQLLFSLWPAIVIFIWVMLIGYINGDARRRGMRYIMWTLLAIFVPNTLGIILYFLLRDPLLVRCPQCGAQGRPGYVFCPQCGGVLCPVCPGCRRSIEPAWKKCAYCGTDIVPSSPEVKTATQ
jgi:hypothetical protein